MECSTSAGTGLDTLLDDVDKVVDHAPAKVLVIALGRGLEIDAGDLAIVVLNGHCIPLFDAAFDLAQLADDAVGVAQPSEPAQFDFDGALFVLHFDQCVAFKAAKGIIL